MRGRRKTTGIYATREELVAEVRSLVALNLPWSIIARRVGVSETTAAKILYQPEEASDSRMETDILTTKEAADYVRLGKPTLERYRTSGEGPVYCKLGGAVRYRKADLDAWVESRRVRSTSERKP